jgi:hypothetical protein
MPFLNLLICLLGLNFPFHFFIPSGGDLQERVIEVDGGRHWQMVERVREKEPVLGLEKSFWH